MKNRDFLYVGVDADGTLFTHEYPNIGKDIGAIPVLRKIIAAGHRLILTTMRDGIELQDAVDWLKSYGIELFGVNRNPAQTWTTSPKPWCDLYIDDAALGCPLTNDGTYVYVDWIEVEKLLFNNGII